MVLEHPGWSTSQYAVALTEDNRRKNPNAKVVLPSTIDSVLSRYWLVWEEEAGRQITKRVLVYDDVVPPLGTLSPEHKMVTPMRYLRELAAAARGGEPETSLMARLRKSALRWEEQMKQAGLSLT